MKNSISQYPAERRHVHQRKAQACHMGPYDSSWHVFLWIVVSAIICTSVALQGIYVPPAGVSPCWHFLLAREMGRVQGRFTRAGVPEQIFCVLQLRGGEPEKTDGVDLCSAGVSDHGLLERDIVQDGSSDLSVLQEYRASSLMRLHRMYDAEVKSMINKRRSAFLGEQEKLEQLHGIRPCLPKEVGEIDYGAAMGVSVPSLRAQQMQRGKPDGVLLRPCDEALLQEEDARYEAAQHADNTGAKGSTGDDLYGNDPAAQKQRRLARIKALLRCKAAALTSEAMDQQPLDGVIIPILEMGNAQQREALRKVCERYRPPTP